MKRRRNWCSQSDDRRDARAQGGRHEIGRRERRAASVVVQGRVRHDLRARNGSERLTELLFTFRYNVQ